MSKPSCNTDGRVNAREYSWLEERLLGESPDESRLIMVAALDKLHERGYVPTTILGKGNTRTAVRASRADGLLNTEYVIKIPHTRPPDDSATTGMNWARGDFGRREITALNSLHHRNIVDIVDVMSAGDSVITVERFASGYSTLSSRWRVGEDPAYFAQVFSQVAAALKYAHSRNIVHRDIKPENILVPENRDDPVLLTDFQNAGARFADSDVVLPTRRGATAFTSPVELRTLFGKGDVIRDRAWNDLYMLGATMLDAITGQPPIQYAVVYDSAGKKITVGGKDFHISLQRDGITVNGVDLRSDAHQINQRIQSVPRIYRGLLRQTLLPSTRDESLRTRLLRMLPSELTPFSLYSQDVPKEHYDDLEAKVDRVGMKKSAAWWDRTFEKIKTYGLIGSVAAIFGAGLGMMLNTNPPAPYVPTPLESFNIHGLLRNEIPITSPDYVSFQGVPPEQRYALLPVLKRYVDHVASAKRAGDVLGRSSTMEKFDEQASFMRYAQERWFPKRLASAVGHGALATAVLGPQPFEGRSRHYLAPMSGPEVHGLDKLELHEIEKNPYREAQLAFTHLQLCGVEVTVPEVVACYFLEKDERFQAQRAANSQQYFSEYVGPNGGVFKPGFRDYVQPDKRRAIDLALTFYQFTNTDGELQNLPGSVR